VVTKKTESAPPIDVAKHSLVPKHIKLSDKEKEKLLERYSITTDQLPKIRLTDPALMNLDAKEGDVIKIVRKSPTAGEADYYRIVVTT